MKRITKILSGLAAGAVNSALGAGGGMIAVPMLKKSGMEQNRAQANAVALIMLLTAASAGIYIRTGKVTFGDSLPISLRGLREACSARLFCRRYQRKYSARYSPCSCFGQE